MTLLNNLWYGTGFGSEVVSDEPLDWIVDELLLQFLGGTLGHDE